MDRAINFAIIETKLTAVPPNKKYFALICNSRKKLEFSNRLYFKTTIITLHQSERGRQRFAHQFACIERLFAFNDVGQQNIHKWVLAIERRTSLIFGRNESRDSCEVALTECVVLLAIKTSPPSVGLSGIDPVVHDPPADESRYWLISIPPVKQQSITIVRAFVNSNLRKFHGPTPVVTVVYALRQRCLSPINCRHRLHCTFDCGRTRCTRGPKLHRAVAWVRLHEPDHHRPRAHRATGGRHGCKPLFRSHVMSFRRKRRSPATLGGHITTRSGVVLVVRAPSSL